MLQMTSSLAIRENSIAVILLMQISILETPKTVGDNSCLTGLKLNTVDTSVTGMRV